MRWDESPQWACFDGERCVGAWRPGSLLESLPFSDRFALKLLRQTAGPCAREWLADRDRRVAALGERLYAEALADDERTAWTPAEDAVIRRWAMVGRRPWLRAAAELPGRDSKAVQRRARSLGLTKSRRAVAG